jgi:hypothetical protein
MSTVSDSGTSGDRWEILSYILSMVSSQFQEIVGSSKLIC